MEFIPTKSSFLRKGVSPSARNIDGNGRKRLLRVEAIPLQCRRNTASSPLATPKKTERINFRLAIKGRSSTSELGVRTRIITNSSWPTRVWIFVAVSLAINRGSRRVAAWYPPTANPGHEMHCRGSPRGAVSQPPQVRTLGLFSIIRHNALRYSRNSPMQVGHINRIFQNLRAKTTTPIEKSLGMFGATHAAPIVKQQVPARPVSPRSEGG